MQYQTDTTTRRIKTTNFKNKKILALIQQIFLFEDFFHRKCCFLFLNKQGLNLISRDSCFFVLKSYFVVNSIIAKSERVALSKV